MNLRRFADMRSRVSLITSRLVLSIITLGLAFFCVAGWGQGEEPDHGANTPPILKIGAHAPDFSLPGIDGKTHSLKDYASSKVLVVIFNCNHCPVAQMYEHRIKQLVTTYKDRGVSVVVIMGNDPKAEALDEYGYTDVGDTLADMKTRAKYRNFNYPYLYDGDTQAVALKYGPTATPHAFVFDQHRILRYEGRIDSNQQEKLATKHEVRDAIEALLAGKPVKVTDAPAVGCSTKWASMTSEAQREDAEFDQKPVTLHLISADQIKTLRQNVGTGKLLLLNVWATWCAPCVQEFPTLQKIARIYDARQISIVDLSINNPDEKSLVLAFLQKQHAFNRNLMFNGNDAADAVKALGTGWAGGAPYTVLIGTKGEILYTTQGRFNEVELRRAIVKNLADDLYLGQHAYWNSTF